MSAAPCKECGRRPKMPGRHRCVTCQLRQAPIGDQVDAARRRLGMVPEELRVKRSKKIEALAPAGTSFCAACQSFRDLADFGKKATTCRPCSSAKAHAAMVAKTYGITGDDYEALFKLQGGKCAICRARPISKRLATDHDHKSGAVRGLLCGRCNHDLMGNAWDSLAIASALWHYLNTPPASGAWVPPEAQAPLMADERRGAVRPSNALGSLPLVTGAGSATSSRASSSAAGAAVSVECTTPHFLPVGSEAVPGKRGVWRYVVEDDGAVPF